jgi:glycosyltransferase involved in cell wall biosynthesis
LTIYALRQARALAAEGQQVTVLTSQHDPSLPLEEMDDGIRIIRSPVAFRLSKGVVMPQMLIKACQLIIESDVINLHLPQLDSALVTILAKLRGKPVVLTHHCDLTMPAGWVNKLAGWAVNVSNRISARLADVIVQNTRDFAEHSTFLEPYLEKLVVIQPPNVVDPITPDDIQNFRKKYGFTKGQVVIGMVARLGAEKGVEYLAEALPRVMQSVPDARVVYVGEYMNVPGEGAYRDKLLPMVEGLGDHWTFLGVLSELEKAAFLHLCDVLVLPSVNSTESFGMVQVEALTCGTPVVTTDLPGVRQPVSQTGWGKIVPIRDSEALAEAIQNVLEEGIQIKADEIEALKRHYSPETIADAYLDLYQSLVSAYG